MCLKPNLARDVFERALEEFKICRHTREMIMVPAASFMFARTYLRVSLAATPKRSLFLLFCLCARAYNVSDEIRLSCEK